MAENKEEVKVEETKEETVETVDKVLKLKKPIMIDGELKSEISYDLESLTGNDIQHANKELTKRGMQVMVSEIDQNYHAMIFSIASGLAFEDISRLGIKDYNAACSLVRDFFLEE